MGTMTRKNTTTIIDTTNIQPRGASASAKGVRMNNKKNARKGKGRRHQNVPQSVIIDRKGRRVGSDDMTAAANLCKWAEHSGLHGASLTAASGVAKGLEAAVQLSLEGEHRDAAKKALSVNYVLRRGPGERVGRLKVDCRDGRQRPLSRVVEWFAAIHFRIADEIEAARDAEAARAAAKVVQTPATEAPAAKVA